MSAALAAGPAAARPAPAAADYWTTALKFYATGRTAEELRAIARAIEELAAAGLTPVRCWYLAGLDQFYGPFPGTARGSAVTA